MTENPETILDRFPTLSGSFNRSSSVLARLRVDLAQVLTGPVEHICVFVVGSHGRLEATAASDFEWMTLYDDKLVAAEEAALAQAKLARYFAELLGRTRLSINKTFSKVCPTSALLTNIGGEADTNQTLSYRMLALIEGTPVLRNQAYETISQGLAYAYAASPTGGHRLVSLATDIIRHWRTLRIDYKHKVDELGRPWAVRNIKLRSYRRFSYLASALHFLASGPRLSYPTERAHDLALVRKFMTAMSGNPALRLVQACAHLGADTSRMMSVLALYEKLHTNLSDETLRRRLDLLSPEDRFANPTYQEQRDLCVDLHRAAANLVLSLPDEPRAQMIEMFLL